MSAANRCLARDGLLLTYLRKLCQTFTARLHHDVDESAWHVDDPLHYLLTNRLGDLRQAECGFARFAFSGIRGEPDVVARFAVHLHHHFDRLVPCESFVELRP